MLAALAKLYTASATLSIHWEFFQQRDRKELSLTRPILTLLKNRVTAGVRNRVKSRYSKLVNQRS